MSVSSILSSNLFSYNGQSVQDRMQQFRKDFQRLGQDWQTATSAEGRLTSRLCTRTARSRRLRKAATRLRRGFNS
jgi:hypothetical protein